MGVCGKASLVIKISFILIAFSCLLQIIGFSAPYWNYNEHISVTEDHDISYWYGLWQACAIFHDIDGSTHCTSFKCDQVKGCGDPWYVVQSCETIAFIVMLVDIIILWIYTCKDHQIFLRLASGICVLGGILAAVGVAVFAKQDFVDMKYFHFSLVLCSVASFGCFIASILIIVEQVSTKRMTNQTEGEREDNFRY